MTNNIKNKAIGLSFLSGVSGISSSVFNIPIKLLTLNALGPINYGLLSIFSLIDKYLSYGELGSKYALSQKVPELLGEGKNEEANSLPSFFLPWLILIYLLANIILYLLFKLGYTFDGLLSMNRLIIISVTLFLSVLNRFLMNYAIGFDVFSVVGIKKIVSPFSPIILYLSIIIWGTSGVLISIFIQNLIQMVSSLYFLLKHNALHLRFIFDLKKLFQLMKSTFSLFSFNTVTDYSAHVIAPSLLVVLGNSQSLGIFHFAEDIKKFAQKTMNGAQLVIGRKIYYDEGKKKINASIDKYDNVFGVNYILYVLLNCLILGSTFIFFRITTELFLSEFSNGLSLALIICLNAMSNGCNPIPYHFLISKKKLPFLNVSSVAWLIMKIGLIFLFHYLGYGILGFGFSILISGVIYTLINLIKALRVAKYNTLYSLSFPLKIFSGIFLFGIILYQFYIFELDLSIHESGLIQKCFFAFRLGLISISVFLISSITIFSLIFYNMPLLSNISKNIRIFYNYLRTFKV